MTNGAPPNPGHSCECHTIRPAPSDAGGWLVHAASSTVRRALDLVLHAHLPRVEVRGGAAFVPPGEAEALVRLASGLSTVARAEIRVAPWREDGPDPWDVLPLDAWAARHASPWFAEATRHLHFEVQPIVSLADGATVGYEALVRAESAGARRGAGDLLTAARAHGQIRAFDALARTEAIRHVYPRLPAGARLFLNFAPGAVYDPRICLAATFATCREVGADFSRLVFEVTESEAFPDLGLLRGILDQYRAEGARVALDDLGAGHTSLSYLEALRPDVVKLDRDLLNGVAASAARSALVGALVEYAHALGIRVVGEGIETAEDLRAAAELGVDDAQGYFLGRPHREVRPPTPEALDVLGARDRN